MPVMTSACGIGSPPNPAAAPRRATTPKSKNTPAPSKLNARTLRSGWGSHDQPVQTETHEAGTAQAKQCRRTHPRGSRCGGPMTSKTSIAVIDNVTGSSIAMISNFA